jgi:hypothetical protein
MTLVGMKGITIENHEHHLLPRRRRLRLLQNSPHRGHRQDHRYPQTTRMAEHTCGIIGGC